MALLAVGLLAVTGTEIGRADVSTPPFPPVVASVPATEVVVPEQRVPEPRDPQVGGSITEGDLATDAASDPDAALATIPAPRSSSDGSGPAGSHGAAAAPAGAHADAVLPRTDTSAASGGVGTGGAAPGGAAPGGNGTGAAARGAGAATPAGTGRAATASGGAAPGSTGTAAPVATGRAATASGGAASGGAPGAGAPGAAVPAPAGAASGGAPAAPVDPGRAPAATDVRGGGDPTAPVPPRAGRDTGAAAPRPSQPLPPTARPAVPSPATPTPPTPQLPRPRPAPPTPRPADPVPTTPVPKPVPTPVPTPENRPAPAATTAAERYGWGAPLPGSDEFDYTGPPNPSKWNQAGECWAGHAGNGGRCASRSRVDGSKLVQTGLSNGNSAWIASRIDQRYGRWEARVRSRADGPANGRQYHPLLIVWPTSDRWPQDGEYDFLENGAPGQDCAESFIHYPHAPGAVQQVFTKEKNCGAPLSEWHTVAFEWTPDHVRGFIDGKKWFDLSGGAGGGRRNIQDMPSGHLTIQLDNFFGGNMQPATYEVDWVRIYPLR